jgi:cytochrome c2
MKNFIAIALFTALTSILYTLVGHLLPQLESHPPAVVALGSNIGPEELAPIGAGVFEANCKQCHKLGESGRAPDLSTVGGAARGRAAERAAKTGKPYSDVDYLVESLCKPGDYLVEGFGNIMPPQGKALTGGQMLAVVAYLQNLGGEPSVKGTDIDPIKRFDCVSGTEGAGGAGAPAAASKGSVGPPDQVFEQFGCSGCHALEGTERKIGPPLSDVGKRLSKGEIYEAILAPDAAIAAGDPPYAGGVMKQTLDGNGFYEKMTPADYQALVDWLAQRKG